MGIMYVTAVEIPHGRYHRSRFILNNGLNYLCEANDENEFMWFMQFAGLRMTDSGEHLHLPYKAGKTRLYTVEGAIVNHTFSNLSDLPSDAKAFKGLSNGSIVDCYLMNDSGTVHIFRPNPNCKEIYKTMPLKEEMRYRRTHCLV